MWTLNSYALSRSQRSHLQIPGFSVMAAMWLCPSVLIRDEVLLRARPHIWPQLTAAGPEPPWPIGISKQPREWTASAFRAGLYFSVTCPRAAFLKPLWPPVTCPQSCKLTMPASFWQNELLCITKQLTNPNWQNLSCYCLSCFPKVHILLWSCIPKALVISLSSANPCSLLKTPTFSCLAR